MNANEFINISIRGRVAFSILCLENVIRHYNVESLPWAFVLEKLWEFTSNSGYLDDWMDVTVEIIPKTVINDTLYLTGDFESMDLECITIEQFKCLHDLYSKVDSVLCFIIDKIFSLATGEMYGALRDGAPYNLEHLQEILNMMEQHNIPLPPIEPLKIYSFWERGGWGKHFDRSELFNS